MRPGTDNPLLAIALEIAPAAVFGASVGFAAASVTGEPLAIGTPALACGSAFLLAWAGLRRFATAAPQFALPPFDEPQPLASAVPLEAEAREQDQVQAAPGELLLDDVLAGPAEDSRVVRLFDRDSVPTAGELQQRIDRHLRAGGPRDATHELHEALDALRRSLR